MTKGKIIVQAQRKFAVGAIVPAQTERRVEPAPTALPVPEPRDVRHCGLPAMQLLNLITMRSIHPHLPASQPVVLLERLTEKDDHPKMKNIKKLNNKIIKKKKVVGSQHVKQVVNQKESCAKQASWSLRSQASKVQRKRRYSDSSDGDDNRPLKFFRKNCNNNKGTKNKLKRMSVRQMKLRLQTESKKNEVKQKKLKTVVSTKKTGASHGCRASARGPSTRARREASARDESLSPGPITTKATIEKSPDNIRTRRDMTAASSHTSGPVIEKSPDNIRTRRDTTAASSHTSGPVIEKSSDNIRTRRDTTAASSLTSGPVIEKSPDNIRGRRDTTAVTSLSPGPVIVKSSDNTRARRDATAASSLSTGVVKKSADNTRTRRDTTAATNLPNLAIVVEKMPDNTRTRRDTASVLLTSGSAKEEKMTSNNTPKRTSVARPDTTTTSAPVSASPKEKSLENTCPRRDANAAAPSADPAVVEKSPGRDATTAPISPDPANVEFLMPRARRARAMPKKPTEPERCACGNSYSGSCEHCTILSSVIAMGDKERRPDELERVVADLVDRAQRTPSIRSPTSADSSDVYAFNEETEVAAKPSSFRTTRPTATSSASLQPRRSLSLDAAHMNRAPDTAYIIRVIDMQTRVLCSYLNGREGISDARHKHVKQLMQILGEYKSKLLVNENTQSEMPSDVIVIDDDVPKLEPLKEEEEDPESYVVYVQEPFGPEYSIRLSDHNTNQSDTDFRLYYSPNLEGDNDGPEIAEAPAFYPTKEEMKDLNTYVEKIETVARKYGIFKIVPPRDFQPSCHLKNVQFKSTNQYISSMFSRWGPAASEMAVIKVHSATQNVSFTRPPLFEGVEVDLVRLYQLVEEHGGLIRVMGERKWGSIAEKMKMNARAGRVKADIMLDKIYMKHLLPYATLSDDERTALRECVSSAWQKRYKRQRARAGRPLHRQRRLLGESESSEEEDPESLSLATAFLEVEDCVVPGANMNLTRFRRVGERVREMRFPGASAGAPPHWADVEREYWQLVRTGTEHVCVHGAALDTSQDALGFPAAVDAPYGNHPWNLKRLGESNCNVLSSLGPTLAVTVPTLHLGMMFSTNCWHHDPHHLPWTEYMHQGPPKIWYGIADSESVAFRNAAHKLCPTAVQNKALWLPSDTAMLPPRLLATQGVRLVRALQAPGEYVVVLPRAFSCSISTGFTVSESLYFAGDKWLDDVDRVFAGLRSDAEPSMFALEALLEGIVKDTRSPLPRLKRAHALLHPLLQAEMNRRSEATSLGVRAVSPCDFLKENRRCSNTSWQVARDECHVCRATLFWSKIIETSTRVSVCLEHGLRLVANRQPEAAGETDRFIAILFYTNHEISQLIADLDKLKFND